MREAGLQAPRRGVPRAVYMSVLAAVLWASAGGTALAQVPDNRDLKLDPGDSVPPFYRGTLDERDRQRFDAAREAGETYMPTFQGAFSAPGDTRAGDGSPVAASPTTPRTAYEGYRRPAREHPSEREPSRAGDLVGVLIEAWTRPPEIVRMRWPEAAGHSPGTDENRASVPEAGGGPPAAASGLRPGGLPRIAAGTGLYARTMYAVDSDYPGPVLLEILEPPLAGAVASGAFTPDRRAPRAAPLPPGVRGPEPWRGRLGGGPRLRLLRRGRRGRQPLVRARAAAFGRALRRKASSPPSPGPRRPSRSAARCATSAGKPRRGTRSMPDWRRRRGRPATCCSRAPRTGRPCASPRNTELVVVFAAPPVAAGKRSRWLSRTISAKP